MIGLPVRRPHDEDRGRARRRRLEQEYDDATDRWLRITRGFINPVVVRLADFDPKELSGVQLVSAVKTLSELERNLLGHEERLPNQPVAQTIRVVFPEGVEFGEEGIEIEQIPAAEETDE